MQITLDTKPFATLDTDALVTYVFEESDFTQVALAELDKLTGGMLTRLSKNGELTGKTLETTLLHAPANFKAARLLLVGAGKRENFNPATLRKVAGAALRYLKSRAVHKVVFLVREGDATEEAAQAVTESAIASDFETDKYKTEKKNDKFIETFTIAGFGDAEKSAGEKGLARGRVIGESQNFARDLVNEPSNKLTPKILADKAAAMAKEAGLAVEILDEKKIAELKMGALLSVAQGSVEPPRMIVLTYTPANPKPGAPGCRTGRQGCHFRYRRHFHQAVRWHGKNEVRHGWRRHDAGHHARRCRPEARRESDLRCAGHGKYARWKSAEARRYSNRHVRQND